MSEDRCENCLYWEKTLERVGDCLRFPQSVSKDATDRCGEFHKKKAKEKS